MAKFCTATDVQTLSSANAYVFSVEFFLCTELIQILCTHSCRPRPLAARDDELVELELELEELDEKETAKGLST